MATVIEGRGERVIERSPREILEWVLDLEQYSQADRKFRTIHEVTRDGNRGTARYSGRLRGVPTPPDRQDWEMAPDHSRLTFRSRPSWRTNVLGSFEGWFECEPVDGATRVAHVERMTVKGPAGLLVRAWIGRWWQEEVDAEMGRLKALLEEAPVPEG